MDRKEATSVLRELLDECDGALMMSCVSLSFQALGSYRLVINCILDDSLRKCVKTVAERHQLEIMERDGKVTVYRIQN
jgi:hypothetical protein